MLYRAKYFTRQMTKKCNTSLHWPQSIMSLVMNHSIQELVQRWQHKYGGQAVHYEVYKIYIIGHEDASKYTTYFQDKRYRQESMKKQTLKSSIWEHKKLDMCSICKSKIFKVLKILHIILLIMSIITVAKPKFRWLFKPVINNEYKFRIHQSSPIRLWIW